MPIGVAALLWSGSFASAQRWEVGVKAGISHGALQGGQEFAWRTANPTTSLFFRRLVTPHISLQPEVSALRRSGVSTQTGSTLTLTADYLEVPLMVHLHGPADAVFRPYVSAGPSIILRLRCTLLFEGGGLVSSTDCDTSQGARSNRVDVGLGGGIGANWRIGAATFTIDSRATTGLRTNVLPVDVQARAYGWMVSAGVSTLLHRSRASGPATTARRMRRNGALTDAQIAAMLLAFANTDISYARLVPRRSTRAELRTHAQQMVVAYTHTKRQVYDLLLKLDIGAEANVTSLGLRDESVEQRDPMYFIDGARFDSAYSAGDARVQRELLSAIEDIMLPDAQSREMRALLQALRPEIRARLERAERLRATVNRPIAAGNPRPDIRP